MPAPTFVQAFSGHDEAGGAGPKNYAVNAITSGNGLAALILIQSGTDTLTDFSFTNGTGSVGSVTRTLIFASGAEYTAYIATCDVTGTGNVTANLTLSAGANSDILIHEYSGMAPSASALVGNKGQRMFVNSTSTDFITSTAMTPTASGCAIMAAMISNSMNIVAGTNFTMRKDTSQNGTADGHSEDLSQSTAASIAGTFTMSSGTNGAAGVAVVALAGTPLITTQPSNQTVLEGNTAQFSVTATTTGTTTYQWQISTNGGSSFSDIGGATSSSYTTPATVYSTDNGSIFRVNITDSNGTSTSNWAYLYVLITGDLAWIRA